MTTATLNFGVLGRCGCGCLGKRRQPFGGEPICRKCMPLRVGWLRVLDPRTSDLLVIGCLTPAQREARRSYLR
jgi:hypothetical protein